ncbi:MAG: beta-ketoacyl-[acyl-carrier-protein] synthase family protein [Thermoanaerobaculia bacterium]
MLDRRVVVTGLGAVTSVGADLESTWKALIEGRCGIGPLTLFDPSSYRTQTAAEVKRIDDAFLDPAVRRRMSRADRIGIIAAREAIENSGIDLAAEDPSRIGVILGGGVSGLLDSEANYGELLKGNKPRPSRFLNHQPDAITDRLAQFFGLRGIKSTITTACSSSAVSMGYASDAIRMGLADVVLTGGSDVLARLTYAGFNSLRSVDPEPCRPFDRNRKGLSIGEAAGILVFEEAGRARRRGAPILAEFRGYGVTSDAYHMTAPEPSGQAGARTIAAALRSARLDPSQVDYINAHGTATPANDSAESAAIRIAFGPRAGTVPVSSTKSMLGHTLCAAGGIEGVISVLAIRDGIAPPTIHLDEPDPECDLDYVSSGSRRLEIRAVLSNSFAFGGNSAVVAFSRFETGSSA